MDAPERDLFSSLVHFPVGLTIESVHPSVHELIIYVACCHPTMACPECQQPSARIHGRYRRTVADLPCAGRNVILMLTVRKFVCGTPTCPRKIFTERLPGLVESYGRMTKRLLALVQVIGLVAGGQQGTRLAERSGIATTPSTLLRQLMQLRVPTTKAVRVLGGDDWSWKKGRRFGTILVDVERHTIIDLLPDRERDSFARWLRDHPSVELISRDRGTDYAAAAREAAPQARQIAEPVSSRAQLFPMPSNTCWPVVRLRFVRGSTSCSQNSQLHPPVPCLTPRPGSSSLHTTWNAPIKPIAARERIAFGTSWSCVRKRLYFAEIARRVSMGERSVRKSGQARRTSSAPPTWAPQSL